MLQQYNASRLTLSNVVNQSKALGLKAVTPMVVSLFVGNFIDALNMGHHKWTLF